MKSPRQFVGLMLLALGVTTGCAPLSTEYGFSASSKGRNSINGFAALRNQFSQSGFECRDIRRFSYRLNTIDTIVWLPQLYEPINDETTKWLEGWLAQGSHTLVYIVPDSGSEAAYWNDMIPIVVREQVFEYRRRAARSINRRFSWQAHRIPIPSNGWMQVEPMVHVSPGFFLKGPWATKIASDAGPLSLNIELGLGPYQATNKANTNPSSTNPGATNPTPTTAGAAAGGSATVQTKPSPSGDTGPTAGVSYQWYETQTPSTTPVTFERLLIATPSDAAPDSKGVTLIAASRSKTWKQSRVIVVAGGSLFTNYAFTQPHTMELVDRLVKEVSQANDTDPRVGFLTTGASGVTISESTAKSPGKSGMEFLTTMPIAIVTLHGLFMGIVALFVLLPVFGRPRRLIRPSLSRFGDHLDAIATLLHRTRDEGYARRRLSDYYRHVRGDLHSPWVIPEPTSPAPASPSATLTSHGAAAEPQTIEPVISNSSNEKHG